MAIDAGNFNGTAHFHLQPCVAMHVLHEVAIDAVHALFNMDVHQMHGQAGAFVGVFGIAFLARFCEVGVVRFFGMTDLQVEKMFRQWEAAGWDLATPALEEQGYRVLLEKKKED